MLTPYKVASSASRVDAWSSFRLPFQPIGAALGLRTELQAAIRGLEGPGDRLLDCVYTSAATEFVDTENVLIYNVGPTAFSVGARNGLRFQRRFAAPPAPLVEIAPPGALHHHGYRFGEVGDSFDGWETGERVAYWKDAAWPSGADVTKLWLAIRRADTRMEHPAVGSHIGARVEIGPRVAIAEVLKPVLDAAISAFHVHAHEEQARAVAARIHEADPALDRRAVSDQLLDQRFNALGARALVSLYRARWKWNPADEFCVAAEVVRGDTGHARGFSGEIFEVTARSESIG